MADLTTNNIHYYGYAANANDSIGSTNGTVDGASNVSGGITGNCYSYDGNNDRIIYGTTTAPADLMWGTGTSYSISLWVNPSTLVGTGQMGLCAAFFRHGFSIWHLSW